MKQTSPLESWNLLTTLNEFNRAYLARLVADIEEDELDLQPSPATHSVRWMLAHIAIVVDYGFRQLDRPFLCPLKWHAAYGPKSQPGSAESIRPTKEELLQVINSGYATLCESLATADAALLNQPHEVELLKGTPLVSKGHILAHILSTHFATHLGQLSDWRRLHGRAPLF